MMYILHEPYLYLESSYLYAFLRFTFIPQTFHLSMKPLLTLIRRIIGSISLLSIGIAGLGELKPNIERATKYIKSLSLLPYVVALRYKEYELVVNSSVHLYHILMS